MTPPPLPQAALMEASPTSRRGLAVISLVIVAAGQSIPKGALYGMSGVGISTAIVRGMILIHLFKNVYLWAIFVYGVVFLIFVLALAAFILSLSVAVRKTVSKRLLISAYRIFGVLALLCCVGLIAADIIQHGPNGTGFDVRNYYFLWPVLFAAISISYRKLSLKFRTA